MRPHLARAELSYDNKVIFGRIAANYMSKRYFTYTNGLNSDSDGLGYVGGRTLVDAAIGYRWKPASPCPSRSSCRST
jgi:iron complex outermembrane receptor protein